MNMFVNVMFKTFFICRSLQSFRKFIKNTSTKFKTYMKVIIYKIMEVVLGSPGLSHIVQKILRNLDFKSLPSMRLVCKSANNQVKDLAAKLRFEDLQKLLGEFTEARSMTDSEKELWNSFLKQAFCNGSESNRFINLYLKNVLSRDTKYKSELKKSPILEFIHYGNESMVQYILDNGLYPIEDLITIIPAPAGKNWTLLHEAESLGQWKISESLKQFSLIVNDHRDSPLKTVIEFDDDDDDDEEPLCLQLAPPNSPQKM